MQKNKAQNNQPKIPVGIFARVVSISSEDEINHDWVARHCAPFAIVWLFVRLFALWAFVASFKWLFLQLLCQASDSLILMLHFGIPFCILFAEFSSMAFILASCSSKLVARFMSFSKECTVCLLEKEMRGRDVPPGVSKICKHKFRA